MKKMVQLIQYAFTVHDTYSIQIVHASEIIFYVGHFSGLNFYGLVPRLIFLFTALRKISLGTRHTALWRGNTAVIVQQYETNFELLLLHEGDNNVLPSPLVSLTNDLVAFPVTCRQ